MKQEILRDWHLRCRSILWQAGIGLAMYALGVIVTGIVVAVCIRKGDEGVTWVPMGTMFHLIAVAMACMLGSLIRFGSEFRLHLCLGGTRRAFLVSFFSRLLAGLLFCYLLVLAGYQAECALYSLLFPGIPNELSLTFLTRWYWLPALVVLAVTCQFLGSLQARFGSRGIWIFWVVWMFLWLVVPRMFNTHDNSFLGQAARGLMLGFLAIPFSIRVSLLAAATVLMGALTVRFGLRQSVT